MMPFLVEHGRWELNHYKEHDMTNTAVFWDRAAEKYSDKPVADEVAYQKKLRLTQRYLRPDMQVLELGCGTGSTAVVHAPFVKHVRATDISSKMIGIAKSKATAANVENITFEVASTKELAVEKNSQDVVMAHSVLHLLKNTDAAVANIHSMLKRGGVFVTSTPCLGDIGGMFKYIAPVATFLRLIPLINVFTERELIESIEQAGFDVELKWQPAKDKAVFIVARKIA